MINKNIVVTGGTGHLGLEIAIKLLSNSFYNLILIDKKKINNKKIINKLNKKFKKRVYLIECDISKKNSFELIKKKINKNFKKIDVIINNAAYYENDKGYDATFFKEKYESWERVFKVNLFAPFFLVQTLYKLMIKSKNSSVINIGSIYGSVAPDFNLYNGTKMTNPGSYNCSKGAMVQLTKWMSSFLAPKIRTNIISPGGIFRNQDKNFLKKYNSKNPMNRMASEIDVANLVNFLVSNDANYLNGQNIFVDGGFSNL